MILEPDSPELHVEVMDDGKIRCHGTRMHQITIHLPENHEQIKTIDLTRNTVMEF